MRTVAFTASLLALVSGGAAGAAEPRRASEVVAPSAPQASEGAACAGPLGARELVGCALLQSLEVRSARQTLAGLVGQRRRAATLLPAHPVLAASVADRRLFRSEAAGGSAVALNWYLTLSQEIEIAGQRGARLCEADAAYAAQLRRVAVAEQETAATALGALFDALAADAEVVLAQQLGQVADALAAVARGRAGVALAAPVEVDAAAAEATRLLVARLEAERSQARARAVLAELLGRADPPPLVGSLDEAAALLAASEPEPPTERLVASALELRGEPAVAALEQRARAARVSLLRRLRVPNLTLSAFAQSDGFDERVLGGGLSLPLPLPGPVGPSRAGELAAAQAELELAETSVEKVRRRVRLEVQRAVALEQSYARELALYPPELVARAGTRLAALSEALAGRQLAVREALVLQRSLLELLQGHLRARTALAQARIERRRAAGQPLLPEGGPR